jgi:hypothetical protein
VELLVINGICGYFLYSMNRVEHEIVFLLGASMLFL